MARLAQLPALGTSLATLFLATFIMSGFSQADQGQDSQRSGPAKAAAEAALEIPPLPQGITSFGGAVVGDYAYVYGGNHGEAHEYSELGQSNELLRVNFRNPGAWERLADGPRMQGLAMVAYDGNLYRVGGFSARNQAGQPQDLWSSDSFAKYNVAEKAWEELPALPEPRSSHDAAMLGSTLYVVGGWSMQGEAETQWHKKAYAMDLAADTLEWRELPAPPFQRRAISMAAANGKMYVVGGMQQAGTTTEVAVFDPETNAWSKGPELAGEGMEGFGSSACTLDDQLFVSTFGGNVYQLNAAGDGWTKLATLSPGRFFHRMLPADGALLLVGGANMEIGRLRETDIVPLRGDE
jgi:N-acetylneuraminic acid mutarotase